MMEGIKVVTAAEMARIEKFAIERGSNEERFMEAAGKKIAAVVIDFVNKHQLLREVLVLVGTGNNGGDAYVAGVELLKKGFQVRALTCGSLRELSPLNKKWRALFEKQKGKVESVQRKIAISEPLILDGLLGTGFKGKVEGKMGSLIDQANESGKPILAIDIPSGLNGSSGEVGIRAIRATVTITLGLPKIGFFLREGWNQVGKLHLVDFGLPESAVKEAEAIAYLPKPVDLPKIVRTRHKYQAGFVVGFGGSKDLPGAIKLSGLAALRSGAGIVRLFSLEELGPAPLELICNIWCEKSWNEALRKAKAVIVGPGLGRTKEGDQWLKTYLKKITLPSVIDADALMPNFSFPKKAILTPHRGEALRLLGLKKAVEEEILFAKLELFCKRKNLYVVLKGAPTFVFAPHSKPFIIPFGDPGMATAGSGDVLTGIIAALLAQGKSQLESAILGVTLHGLVGETVAREKTSYCLIAEDLIEALPLAFKKSKEILSSDTFYTS